MNKQFIIFIEDNRTLDIRFYTKFCQNITDKKSGELNKLHSESS